MRIKTNIGLVPKEELRDIQAVQLGFDDYEDMKKNGLKIEEKARTFSVTFNAEVLEDSAEEFKRSVDHHIDRIIDLDSWPEIIGIEKAKVEEIAKTKSCEDEITIYIPEVKSFMKIEKSIGDFLQEDYEEGYVDGVNVYTYYFSGSPIEGDILDDDGGVMMLKEKVEDTYNTDGLFDKDRYIRDCIEFIYDRPYDYIEIQSR